MNRREFLARVAQAAGLASGALPAGCSLGAEAPLRVGAIVWPGYECLFLARALGLLDSQPIKLIDFTSTPEAIRTFRNGALEVLAVTADEFLRLAAHEPNIRAFLITDFSRGADALIARQEFDCVRKLAGKRIAVEVNATGVYMLTRSLAAVGMKRSDIEVVSLETDQHLAAFSRGEVDAAVTFEPYRTHLLKSGGRVLFDSSRFPEQADFLVARRETLITRAERIRAVTAAWFQAREMMVNKPAEAAPLVAPREGLTSEEFVAALKLISIPSLAENRRLLSSADTELMSGLRGMSKILRECGQFEAVDPSLALFTAETLP